MSVSMTGPMLDRRGFLMSAAAASGAFVLRFTSPAMAKGAAFAPDQFLRIGADGAVTLVVPYAEMGQGILTGAMMIVAEELDVDPSSVRVELAPGDDALYGSPLFGDQITGGSGSTMGSWISLRRAGAAARQMLVAAAAETWGASPASCRTESGTVIHPDGRTLSYGDLAANAATQAVPEEPTFRTGARRVLGTALPRVDTPAKVSGTAIYGIDVRLPGMVYAAVANTPHIGGRLVSVDPAPALAVTGVGRVVPLDASLADIASHTGAALKGLAALAPVWDAGASAVISTEALVAGCDRALDGPAVRATDTGDADAAMGSAATVIEATYRLPMLAHAAMEPINCTVSVSPDSCELWLSTQVPGHARKVAAAASGLPIDKVRVNAQLIGGGFGRRLETDWIAQSVQIGLAAGAPVKMIWSREEDMRNDAYRFHG